MPKAGNKTGVYLSLLLLVTLVSSCEKNKPLFNLLSPEQTGIYFNNRIEDTDTLNILDYLYYYNGAGVSIGDINNDGLPDIYFAANQNGNKLYLNKGHLKFEDITNKAGVKGNADWTTGVSMADVNGDGLLDIYVCTVSNHRPSYLQSGGQTFFQHGKNQLFINQGNNTFKEQAHQWNVDISGYNTQSVFFDYDHDGDLDMFLLQHSIHQTASYGDTARRKKYSEISGGKLFRNEGNYFTDVTKGSGIISSALGYGLGVAVADFDHNGFDDIYVGNDFHENDYYYMNEGNGTFKEMNASAFKHESHFSMGNDAADINNDGWTDLVTLDMLPENDKVLKSSLGEGPLDEYMVQRRLGYNYQYSRNCLQLNTGAGKRFSEIGLYAGIAATDWSWSALAADYDLDGNKDIFISNGIKKRLNDLDYLKFISNSESIKGKQTHESDKQMLEHMPDGKWHNYFYKGNENLHFLDVSALWGIETANISNGAAYSDLDNDGDLDIVTNNINETAGIFENTASALPDHHYINIRLKGNTKNTFATGAKVFVFVQGHLYYQELQSARGFLSSSQPMLNFGLGNARMIDSMLIVWPGNQLQRVRHIKSDQTVVYEQGNPAALETIDSLFVPDLLVHRGLNFLQDISDSIILPYQHKEDVAYIDFNRQLFIPHMVSTEGPHVAVADVNGDGLDDMFCCGAKGQPGAILIQQPGKRFISTNESLLMEDANSEDVDAVFFDANNDGYKDLYVVSGGNEFFGEREELKDRLYINDGKGRFTKSSGLPAMYENKSPVCVADLDHDGDNDLFVGGRVNAQSYGLMPTSYILLNDGRGNFTIATGTICKAIENIGMVTSACFSDLDRDGWDDLIVVGEWMAPAIFKNKNGKLVMQINDSLQRLTGWWHTVKAVDINDDGLTDLVLGNYGLNSKLQPSESFPVKMYLGDMDGNGSMDQIVSIAKNKKYYPFLDKEVLESRLPYLKKEYLSYGMMAGKSTEEIFKDKLPDKQPLTASCFSSGILMNTGKGHFSFQPLPATLQWSPVFSFYVKDFNHDGKTDLFAGGNFYGVNPYEGRYDALPADIYLSGEKGSFHAVMPVPGELLKVEGEIRDIKTINMEGQELLIVARNNMPLVFLKFIKS